MEDLSETIEFFDNQIKKTARFKSSDSNLSLDQLPLKTPFFQASDLQEQLNISASVFKYGLNILEEKNSYKYPRKGNFKLELTRDQAIEVANHFDNNQIQELRAKNDNFEVPVVLIHNGKGGIGKTTAAITLATQSSFDMKYQPRTLLIDGDTQGSIRHQLAPGIENVSHTIGELLTSNIVLCREERLSPEKQSEFREYLLGNVIVDTHADGVSLLPSFSSDKILNVALASSLGGGMDKDAVISAYKDIVISPLKNDFDLVIIDANPAIDMMLYGFYYVANMLIIPVTGRQQDVNAYCDYLGTAKFIFETMMPEDCKGFDSVMTLVTKNVQTNKDIFNRSLSLKNAAQSFTTVIFESKVYEDASADNLPIQLMNHTSRNIKGPLLDAKTLYNEMIHIAFAKLLEEHHA